MSKTSFKGRPATVAYLYLHHRFFPHGCFKYYLLFKTNPPLVLLILSWSLPFLQKFTPLLISHLQLQPFLSPDFEPLQRTVFPKISLSPDPDPYLVPPSQWSATWAQTKSREVNTTSLAGLSYLNPLNIQLLMQMEAINWKAQRLRIRNSCLAPQDQTEMRLGLSNRDALFNSMRTCLLFMWPDFKNKLKDA